MINIYILVLELVCILITAVVKINYYRTGIIGALVTYELNDDKVIILINDNMRTELLSSAMTTIVQYADYLSIYVGEAAAFHIPLRAFPNEGEKNNFIERVNQIRGHIS